ncbi:hypothetical protein K438DRAFT_1879195, partial [Mycena galopus ATCC 62051]
MPRKMWRQGRAQPRRTRCLRAKSMRLGAGGGTRPKPGLGSGERGERLPEKGIILITK